MFIFSPPCYILISSTHVWGIYHTSSLPEEEDWSPIRDISQASWEATVDELNHVHRRLIETISRFNEAQLGEKVPGANYTFYHMLHGLVQHNLYHAGQIAILKKK